MRDYLLNKLRQIEMQEDTADPFNFAVDEIGMNKEGISTMTTEEITLWIDFYKDWPLDDDQVDYYRSMVALIKL